MTINNQKKKEFKDKIEKFESNKKQTWTDVIHIDKVNIKCVKISNQFCRIYTGLSNYNINLYSLEDGELIVTFIGHEASINTIDFNTYDSLLYSGSSDNTIKIWKTYNAELVHTIKIHSAPVTKILLNPKCDLLYSCSWDKTIKI